jgi:TonB-linked SusC/RagA family outer membrane protein
MKRLVLYILCLIATVSAAAQDVLQGRVIDARTQEPVIGAAIQIRGTHNNTVSDIDGNFSLKISGEEPYTLDVTFVGYLAQEIEVYDTSEPIEILLRENTRLLNEVVVVGYGTAKLRDLTASITSINKESLKGVTGNSIDNILEGHAAGVMVSTSGSQVGSAPVINIRGLASITSSVTPLYVVDGVPVNSSNIASSTDYNPIADINPADIKSIDILKDAAASAMYGSRAAAGVVLITTNSGSAGKTKLTYDYNLGFNSATKLFTPMNAEQYTDIKNRGWLNNGGDPNNLPYATMTDKNGNIVNTNWVDLIFRTGLSQNHNLNLQGGNDKATYYLSGSYTTQEGITVDAKYDRFSFKGNGTYKLNKFVKIGFNTGYTYSKIHTADDSRGGSLSAMGGLTRLAYVDLPNVPAYNEDGTFYASTLAPRNLGKGNNAIEVFYYNAMGLIDGGQYGESRTNRILANGYAEITPIKGLTLKTLYGIDWTLVQNESFSTPLHGGGYPDGSSRTGTSNLRTWTWTNTANYQFDIKKHHFDILFGVEASASNQHVVSRTGTTLSNPDQMYVEASYLTYGGSGSIQESSLFSYISRFTYDWKSRYYLTANWRRDGLSKLGRKWGNFYGISGAWRISDEPFFRDLRRTIDDLKIKVSYGVVGNANVGWYASKSVYSSSTYNGNVAYVSSGINDPNLGWEQTGTADVGFSASLLKGRFNIDVDYFYSRSKDLILDASQAYSTGIVGASVSTNLGKTLNKGLEITVSGDLIRKKNFTWSSSFNISFVKNEVVELADDILYSSSTGANITTVGYSLAQLYTYPTDGIDPQMGRRVVLIKKADGSYDRNLLIYKYGKGGAQLYELDGETLSKYTLSDWKPEISGNTKPTYYGGWSNTFRYKNWDAKVNFHFSGGNKILNAMRATLSDGRMWSCTKEYYDNIWQKPGDHAKYAKASYNDNYSNGTANLISDLIEDGDFLRLQSLSIGYQFNTKKWSQNLGISSVRLYAQAQNLFCLTGYTGFDPEINSYYSSANLRSGIDLNTTPLTRTITFGANISF